MLPPSLFREMGGEETPRKLRYLDEPRLVFFVRCAAGSANIVTKMNMWEKMILFASSAHLGWGQMTREELALIFV